MKRYVIQKGKKIPLMAVYHSGRDGITTTYEPQYVLITREEAVLKEKRDKKMLGKYFNDHYPTDAEKCCGVYPKFITELRQGGESYYVCPVCGKEGMHCAMAHLSKKAWNESYYKWLPVGHQYTVFELFHDLENAQKGGVA